MSQLQFNLAPERKIWSVSGLTAQIRDVLEANFHELLVEGEISNCRAAQSGHIYFTLKDAHAQIRCLCFRDQARLLKFRPEDGLHVTVRGSLGVYEQRGEYQIYVGTIEPVGFGALQLAFEQMKARLEAEGLFDTSRKKPLPLLPQQIGIVTSPAGAALSDVLRILRRRFPNVNILIYPVRVQGEGAAAEIAAAIAHFNRAKAADVLLLVRGGGSLEDLWAFNEEVVARAIAASRIPTVSGVGHETDFTIADFVADVRAATPSNAAEIVVRTRDEFDRHIAQLAEQLGQHIRYLLLERRHRVQELTAHRGFRRLESLVRQRRQRADELAARLGELLARRLEASRRRFAVAQARIASFDLRARIATLAARLSQRAGELRARIERLLTARLERVARLRMQLDERSPLRVLERGYAIVYDPSGAVLRDAAHVAVGDSVSIRLARGRLTTEVRKKEL
jgi:exodeoxyribonuclease VII large subunit